MSAYVVVNFTVKDPSRVKEYSRKAKLSLESAGARFLAKGPNQYLHGESDFSSSAIIEFFDKQTALDWYTSPEYKALVDNRNQGMASEFILVTE